MQEKNKGGLSKKALEEIAKLYDEKRGVITAGVVGNVEIIKVNGTPVYQSDDQTKGTESNL